MLTNEQKLDIEKHIIEIRENGNVDSAIAKLAVSIRHIIVEMKNTNIIDDIQKSEDLSKSYEYYITVFHKLMNLEEV